MKLVITICSTQKYSYAVRSQANSVYSAVLEYCRARKVTDINPLELIVILVSDGCQKMVDLVDLYKKLFSNNKINFFIEHIILQESKEGSRGYNFISQKLIGKLRTEAFTLAKGFEPDYCLSLDSDVLMKANSLVCLEDVLNFDSGYYSVAMCNYPSQGGGLFLGGRGTYQNRILDNVFAHEKKIEVPEKIKERMDKLKDLFQSLEKKLKAGESSPEDRKLRAWNKFLHKNAPALGNVFELNSKEWRKRGWFDFAYPGIGKGSIVPTDWTGFGCILMNQKALNLIDFSGYYGAGTEDLFINWERWHPNGIKMACIPHCPADHVIRKRISSKREDFSLLSIAFTYHEPSGEAEGHLRQKIVPFVEYL